MWEELEPGMFALGHVGLTWGGAVLLVEVARRLPDRRDAAGHRGRIDLDYRFVILGSLLPDLLDKPLGVYLFPEALGSGRAFGHSLLFLALLAGSALVLRGSWRRALASTAFGCAVHLPLDRLWAEPETLAWPLLRRTAPPEDVQGWAGQMLQLLAADPLVYMPEIVGGVIVTALAALLLRRGGARELLRSGRLSFGRTPRLGAGQQRPHQLQRGHGTAER
ncbi:MAG: metal-dependent hydrolase [Dehalococcoidia bacterium]